MPNYRDRYVVEKADRQKAEQYVHSAAKRLGLIYYRQLNAIDVSSSDEYWLQKGEGGEINPELVNLVFNFSPLGRDSDYLRRIEFDVGGKTPVTQVTWQVSETSGDPPPSLEELIRRSQLVRASEFLARAEENPAFFEIYLGIYQRLFPEMEHEHLHTDVQGYDEASSSALKKELWRTDLLTKLQGLRFPEMEFEEITARDHSGVRVIWQPQGHVNYQIWFNLFIEDDPKACVYVDPSQSGSTTGWLSTRLIKNENALEKLPYTLEQWAVEDLRRKKAPEYSPFRKTIRELLLHHLPRDMEEVWAAIRRQLVGVRHEELHGDVSAYDESLVESLREEISGKDEAFLAQLRGVIT